MTVTVVADHSALLALPAFAPALLIAGIIVFMVIRDRRKPDDPADPDSPTDPESAGTDSGGAA